MEWDGIDELEVDQKREKRNGFLEREREREREILILKNLGQQNQTYREREGAKFWEGKFWHSR